jgi:integrase
MANKKGRRRFGNVRKLPSGRWQARYPGADGMTRKAPQTFATQGEAAEWLTLVEADIIRGDWSPPEAGDVPLGEYARRWIDERKLAPRTRELYAALLRLHIAPHLGTLPLAEIRPQTIRTWRGRLLTGGTPEPQAVKAYRLLRAVFNTAVKEDGLVRENPCRIKGYDRDRIAERPIATVEQVYALADAMPERFYALVIVAALTGLRWGELAALERGDIDLAQGTVRVVRTLVKIGNQLELGPPKSAAGVRVVALPEVAVEALREHLVDFVAEGDRALVFTGAKGAPLRSGNFGRAVRWTTTVREVGLPAGFHFHDLRHTGNTLAAETGASTRELMHRMGHSSIRAAMIYQHATRGRDHEIAAGIDQRLAERLPAARRRARANGTPMARDAS